MQWLLFTADSVAIPKGPYHNTIDGQIVTAIVCIAFCLWALWTAYRNFIVHKSTADIVS
jgi:hypothetical protein